VTIRRAGALPPTWRASRAKLNTAYPGVGDLLEWLAIANAPNGDPNLAGSRIQRLIDGDEQMIARTLKVLDQDTGEGVTVIQIIDTIVKIVHALQVGDTIYIDPDTSTIQARAGDALFVFGALFGEASNLILWIGPDVDDVTECTVGSALWGVAKAGSSFSIIGSEAAGAGTSLNFVTSDDDTGTGHSVTIIHADDGPPPTMGGNALGTGITASWTYSWNAQAVLTSGVPAPGAISAVLTLERTKGGGAAGSVSATTGSLSASGTREVEPHPFSPGAYLVTEYMTTAGTYADPDIDTDPRTFELTLTSRTGTVLTGAQNMTLATNEEA
jgi:hypothetical protein